MSYSIVVHGPTKGDALKLFAIKFDQQVVAQQPIHAKDRAAVLRNIQGALDVLSDEVPDGKRVAISASGGIIGVTDRAGAMAIGSVAISASVYIETDPGQQPA